MDEPLKSPLPFGYRNKMEFSFGDEVKGGPLCLGMHKKNSTYDVVNTLECKIVDEDVDQVVAATVAYFREREIIFIGKCCMSDACAT